MPSLEDNLKKELRQTLGILPKEPSIYRLPNPIDGDLPIIEGRMFHVRGIKDGTFSPLNGEYVLDMGKLKPERTVRERTGRAKRGANDEIVKEKPSTPEGTKYIRTKRKIDIPFKFSEEGFNYADSFEQASDGYKYIYAIPKDNLYTVHLTALAVSSRSLRCFHGHKFKTWHYGSLTIAVIPYNPNSKYTNTLILGTKVGLSYDEEIQKYVNGLIQEGVIPNVPDFVIDGGYTNLVYEEAQVAYEGYEEESVIPLSEERSLSYTTAASLVDEDPEVDWDEPEE